MTKEFDLIVHGATGYTGRIICEYLARLAHAKDISWAISGRSEAKLTSLAKRLETQNPPEVIVAHSLQADSMADLASRTRVVIATVGPYLLFGEELVAACVKAGTDYVDLAGEASWIRSMIDKYGADAASSGARIVHSCGFDSIPTDLGVYKLQSIALEKLRRPFSRVKGRVEELIGEPSGGTIHSILASLKASAKDENLAALLRNPYALCPGFQGPKQPKAHLPVFDSEFDSWNAAFVMAEINTKTLHRSNFLLSHRYGTDFLYDEMLVTGPGEAGKAAAEKASDFSSMFSPDARLPQPGEGPTRQEREAGCFSMAYHGLDGDTVGAVVRVHGDQDPGYGTTSKMITESALCLLQDDVNTKGGVWTPATCMGDQLLTRLHDRGVLRIEAQELNLQ